MDSINQAMEASHHAFLQYKNLPLAARKEFLYTIAAEMEAIQDDLLQTAMQETNLTLPRLKTEFTRTLFQLRSYADACAEGNWLDARIDTGTKDPYLPDIRKMLVPLGPVVVFGASNFPFAYSTAGGDTACALAAGCSVVVKAHPAHPETSRKVARAIRNAAVKSKMPAGIFGHIEGKGFETGELLVKHPLTKAVGFTGSFSGGKQLFDWGNQRKTPIPVFAEMGSVNPVFILPKKLEAEKQTIAEKLAASLTVSVGQFCTNPGLLVAIESPALEDFKNILVQEIKKTDAAKMLHEGIYNSFTEKRKAALSQTGVTMISEDRVDDALTVSPTLATVSAQHFLENKSLAEEVFGPYSLLIVCRNPEEMLQIVHSLEGQLTTTLFATDEDVEAFPLLPDALKELCGRLILNDVPTGVRVCLSMHHGGPFPATTDSRFTAVGADGIRRFARPLAFQNFEDHLLPEELKDANPAGIERTVNNFRTRMPVIRTK